jgi:MFS family permease
MTSGLVFPTLGALMTNRVASREGGTLMGVTTALGSFMSILGPLWAGTVYDQVMPSAPYWIGAIVFALAACVLIQTPTPVTLSARQ